jgi:chromosome segregation ATPase
MPPTVKSLEERIDQIASDLEELTQQTAANTTKLDGLSSQIATLTANQSASQNQIDKMVSEVGGLSRQTVANNIKLDALSSQIATLAANQSSSQNQLTVVTVRLDLLSSQLATLMADQSANQNQLAVVIVKLDGAIEQLKSSQVRMDGVTGKLEAMTTDYIAHKSKAETMFAFTKWIGVFVAGVLSSGLLAAFTVVRTVGSYETTIQQQQKTLDQHSKTLDEIARDVTEIRNKQK